NFARSDGADSEAIIYQPSTKKYWEVWLHAKTGAKIRDSAGRLVDEWQAGWGGYIADLSINPGYFGRGPVFIPFWGWGASSTSIAVLSSIITIEEQQSGLINHPLQLVITYRKGPGGSVFARPAQRSDGWVEHPDPPPPAPAASIPKGVCFRLPASLNLDAM